MSCNTALGDAILINIRKRSRNVAEDPQKEHVTVRDTLTFVIDLMTKLISCNTIQSLLHHR